MTILEKKIKKSNLLFSRVTPGGKAAAANVNAGDYLLAVNMQNLEDSSLLDVMELIKGNRFNNVKTTGAPSISIMTVLQKCSMIVLLLIFKRKRRYCSSDSFI